MNSACKHFSSASSYVSRWIAAQPTVGEESITDWLLYELSRNIPPLKYKKFTKHQEAQVTGADWEWWFVGAKQSLRLRIQAKKLKSGVDNYPSLAYSNAHGLQIEKLLTDASKANALAFYAFYSAPLSSNFLCRSNRSIHAAAPAVLLASAKTLEANFVNPARRFVSETDIANQCNPYECLVCCPLSVGSERGKIQGIYEHIRHYYGEALEAEESANIRSPIGLHDELPPFVSSLLETRHGDTPEGWELEFPRQLPEVDSILVWDMRENDL